MRLRRGKFAILRRAHFDADERRGCRAGAFKHVGAVHQHLDRLAGFPCEQCRYRLHIDVNLAAEPSANLHRHHLNLRDGVLEDFGELFAHGERALRATPDGELPIGVVKRGGVVRFNVALVDGAGDELAFDDDICFSEPFLYIAFLVLEVAGDVAGFVSGFAHRTRLQGFVEERCIRLHRCAHL